MGNEASPCKWNSFGTTPSAHTKTHSTGLVFTESTTACCRKPPRIPASRKKEMHGRDSAVERVVKRLSMHV